jgi:hypothetical protein
MPFIESTSKSSSGLSLLYISFVLKLLEFRIVNIEIKNSDLCNFCKNTSDSILHYIWLCPVVKLFWNRIKTWLEEISDISINFESFVTRYELQKTSLKLISVSISDFHLEMPFIESTSKSSSGLSLLFPLISSWNSELC